jgi:hypothetical protein
LKKTTERPLTTPADHYARAAEAVDKPARPSFGHSQPGGPREPTGLDFDALRGGGDDRGSTIQPPRGMIPVFIATIAGILLGGVYFIATMLAFKTAILANETSVPGPYPSFAVIFVIIPAFCGPFYFLMDYLGGKTGISPFTSIKGIAATIIIGALLLELSFLPAAVIRYKDNSFASQHGYTYCASVFDPQRVHIYALASYAAVYGCPTAAPPQQ